MTWFSLPETQTVNRAAFYDAAGAATWLAGQPQANVTAMLDALVAQLSAFNTFTVPPRERFKVLEVLRKYYGSLAEDEKVEVKLTGHSAR